MASIAQIAAAKAAQPPVDDADGADAEGATDAAADDGDGADTEDAADASSEAGGTFTKPDLTALYAKIPNGAVVKDQADRIEAAGMKMMYAPAMRDDLKKAVASQDPTPKVLAENVVGLLLTLDQKAGKSGLPPAAIMPATVMLLADAADLMVKAGRPVSQDDFKHAIQEAFVLNGKKMGGTGAQIMDTANKALPPDQQVAGGAPPDGPDVQNDPITPPAAPAGAAPGAPPAGGGIAAAAAAQAPPQVPQPPQPDEEQQP